MKHFTRVLSSTTLIVLLSTHFYSQNVGIGATSFTPNSSAGLDINFTDKGLLLPRVALTASNSNAPIGNNIAVGLMVYNTDSAGIYPNQVVPGLHYWNGTIWNNIGSSWHKSGNSGTVPGTDFIGTTDTNNLVFKVNNQMAGLIDQTIGSNTFFGYQAGSSIDSNAQSSAFFGYQSGMNTLDGVSNTANGALALYSNTSGSYNTANGNYSLYFNQGSENVANGYAALYLNNTGNENIATGDYSLNNNSSGSNNVAEGYGAASSNSSGSFNTAVGNASLNSNQVGSHNVAIGNNALFRYLLSGNTAVGDSALAMNTDDGGGGNSNNTAIGFHTLSSVSIGINNVGLGCNAGMMNNTGNGNIFIGYDAGYNETGSNKLYISNSSTTSPLIGGDFSTGIVTINSILKLPPASLPSSPTAGTLYFDNTLNKLRCYDGTTWHNLW